MGSSRARRKGQRILWTPRALALLGTLCDSDVAKRLEISSRTVYRKRVELGVRAFNCMLMTARFEASPFPDDVELGRRDGRYYTHFVTAEPAVH